MAADTENPPRHEVAVFARAMEGVLRKHNNRGRRIDGIDPDFCLERIWQEVRELDRAAWNGMHGDVPLDRAKRIQREAADVANFCAMVWWAMEGTKGDKSPHIGFMNSEESP